MTTAKPGEQLYGNIQIKNTGNVSHTFIIKIYIGKDFLTSFSRYLTVGSTSATKQAFQCMIPGTHDFNVYLYDGGGIIDSARVPFTIEEEMATVVGKVRSAATYLPLPNAKITLGNTSTGESFITYTLNDGTYSVEVSPGRYTGAVTKTYYYPTIIFPFTIYSGQQISKDFLMMPS